jgi:Na+:H+ antiporter, NhaC family
MSDEPVGQPALPAIEDPEDATRAGIAPGTRAPSLGEALLSIGILVVLVLATVLIFGTDATGGPLQVSLLVAAVGAGFIALRLGMTTTRVREAAIGGVSSAMGAIYILLAVGALIGTWNMAGTIPTVVYYGIGLLQPAVFYLSAAIICGLVGLVIGSSWTTAATLGVALIALAPLLGADPVIAAGAVVSGAYFGDKMSPLSETTVLVPSMVGGVTVYQHIGAMIWTSGPAFLIALVIFTVLGLIGTGEGTFDRAAAQATLAAEFNITLLNLLPLVLLLILSLRRVPTFLTLLSCAIFAGVLAWFTQPDLVVRFAGETEASLRAGIEALYLAMATGFVSTTGIEPIDELFSRGGMASMLFTIWLVLGALSYASIVEQAGVLHRLVEPLVARARSTGRLIATVIGTAIGLNLVAGDQYVAIVMPSRVYRLSFRQRRLAPRMLSRAVEDSGTVTSPLVPWNSCGAYMAGVLGVATLAYLPYAFFNLISPLVSMIYGFTGFRIEHLGDTGSEPGTPSTDAPTPAPSPG